MSAKSLPQAETARMPGQEDRQTLSAEANQSSNSGNSGISALSQGLQDNFGSSPASESSSTPQGNQFRKNVKKFEERLPPAAKEAFNKLDNEKKQGVMELGKNFGGSEIEDSSLTRLMQSGKLFERDLDGATPMEKLSEAGRENRDDGKGTKNFMTRMMNAIDRPGQNSDAERKGDKAELTPAGFIEKATEEHRDSNSLGEYSQWTESPQEIS